MTCSLQWARRRSPGAHAPRAANGALGHAAAAQTYLEEAVAVCGALGNSSLIAELLNDLGWRAHLAGEDERASGLLEESLALCRDLGDLYLMVYVLSSLGLTLLEQREYARAQALHAEGLHLAQHLVHKQHLIWYLEGFAWMATPLAAARGNIQEGARRAARLFGAAEALSEAIGAALMPTERAIRARHVAAARIHLAETAWTVAWDEGRAMTLEQAIAYALEASPDA